MSLLKELAQRNALRVLLAYVLACWLLTIAVNSLSPFFSISESVQQALTFLLVIGAIPAVILTCATENPLSARRLNHIIALLLVMSGILFLAEPYSESHLPASAWVETDATAFSEDSADRTAEPVIRINSSLAILPFETRSYGPDDEFFAAGLTEELINIVSLAPGLRVIGRDSVFGFKGIAATEAANALGASHTLEGSLSRAGSRFNLQARLMRISDEATLWSQDYSGRTDEVFDIQTDMVDQAIMALQLPVSESQRAQIRTAGIRNVQAITEYQKGVDLGHRARAAANPFSLLREANIYFGFAVDIHPNYFSAYRGQAELFFRLLMIDANGQVDGYLSPEDLASAPTRLYRLLDNTSIAAWTMRQRQHARFDSALVQGNWRGLSSRLSDHLELAGCTPAQWVHLAGSPFGYAEQLLKTYQAALACDPMVTGYATHLVMSALWQGDPQTAIAAASTFLERKKSVQVATAYVLALAAEGQKNAALQVIDMHLPDDRSRTLAQAMVAAQSGLESEARQSLEQFLGQHGPDDYHSLLVQAMLGNRQQANELAARIDGRDLGHIALMNTVYFCACGAPFDLEFTPGFTSRLADSGLNWPPPSPLRYPLRDR